MSTKVYKDFFENTEEGVQLMNSLHKLIDNNHKSAENDGETARDYTQRAKGIREVINHINSLKTGAHKTNRQDNRVKRVLAGSDKVEGVSTEPVQH